MTAQHIINSLEFARKSLEIRDTISNSQLSRAKDLLANGAGSLNWRLIGDVGADKESRLHFSLTGDVFIPCQRCLEPMQLALNIESEFILVKDESDIPSEDDDVDEHDYLVADAEFNVMQLLEDEVLLAIPYAPKHDEKDCPASLAVTELKAPNPFGALKDFKAVKN